MPTAITVRCADGFTHSASSLDGRGRCSVPPADARAVHAWRSGSLSQTDAVIVPSELLGGALANYVSDRVNLHLCSDSFVFRWRPTAPAAGGERFTKAQALANRRDPPVSREAAVLRWLHDTHPELATTTVPAPKVVGEVTEGGAGFLLTEGLAGRSYGDLQSTAYQDLLASTGPMSKQAEQDAISRVVRSNAVALRRLHDSVSIAGCPFIADIPSELAVARARLRAGVLGNLRVAAEEHGRGDEELDRLEALAPSMEAGLDLVFTHGDYCSPNVLHGESLEVTGVVDWGYAGVADRWRDLVKAQWSVGYNYGEEWGQRWLEWYGAERDEKKATYYDDITNFL